MVYLLFSNIFTQELSISSGDSYEIDNTFISDQNIEIIPKKIEFTNIYSC